MEDILMRIFIAFLIVGMAAFGIIRIFFTNTMDFIDFIETKMPIAEIFLIVFVIIEILVIYLI